MNFLLNLRNRYSFNFLAVIGLINLLVFLSLFIAPSSKPPFFEILNPGMGFVLVLFAVVGFSVVAISIAIFLHLFLKVQIANDRFLNSKLIFFLQIIGIVCFFAPIFLLLFLFVLVFLSPFIF